MTGKRRVDGVLYAWDELVFGFMYNHLPYTTDDEWSKLQHLAEVASNEKVGNLMLKLFQDPEHPTIQPIVVLTSTHSVDRRHFQTAVTSLFPECELKLRWVTGTQHAGDELDVALARLCSILEN